MTTAASLQSGVSGSAQRLVIQTPPTPQTPSSTAFQTSTMGLAPSQTLSSQSIPLTPPLTPAQTPSPNTPPLVQQQLNRSPPLLHIIIYYD
ncbi:hypothetical protein XENOCAPTIV_013402 [Xenoophorus captivus]|uniref:Uncharacterized protein n=1 Tax=Xenoophorus captivus TaxID=1517983 RepID=A0ABV0QJ71_9TELE